MSKISRRGFLKGAAVGTGLAMGTRLGGASWLGQARAGVEEPAVVVIHFLGGYTGIFGSSASFLTPVAGANFSVTSSSFTNFGGPSSPGGGVTMDNVVASTLSPFARQHIAQIGVSNMLALHQAAQPQLYTMGAQSAPLLLAEAMGGTAAIKAALIGQGASFGNGPTTPVNGTSLQKIRDMASTISALGGGATPPSVPDRARAATALAAAQGMSSHGLTANPVSEASLAQGYPTVVSTLQAPVQAFSLPDFQSAYGLGTATAISGFASKMAGAELMVRSGSNVVLIFDGSVGWDTHSNPSGNVERNGMAADIVKPLNTFLNRMLDVPGRNVVVALVGDFARVLPNSGHAKALSATVFGKYVVNGTTGALANNGDTLRTPGPGVSGLWSYLAAAAHVPTVQAFGPNPHGLVA
jgi:hypothetical protein